MDHDRIKELICLNCESYEFFQKELMTLEAGYFDSLEQLLAVAGNFTDMMLTPDAYMDDKVIIKKLENLRASGEQYIAVSIKFEKEMQEMRRLAPDLRDSDIEFDGVKNRFHFISDYLEELEQSLLLQYKTREVIETQVKLFKGFERYE